MTTLRSGFHLHIDPSIDASSQDYANFTISFLTAIRFRQVIPLNVTIPFGWYPVNANNNIIKFKDTGGTTRTATLTNETYTSSQLATSIASAMNAAGGTGTYACSFNSQTNKFTINETSGPSNFQLLFGTGGTGQINLLIGYNSTDHTGAATYTSDNVANVSGPNYIYITSNSLAQQENLNMRNLRRGNTLLKIPIGVNPGSTVVWDNRLTEYGINYENEITLNQLDIALYNPDGTQVNMNGLPWSISLAFMI